MVVKMSGNAKSFCSSIPPTNLIVLPLLTSPNKYRFVNTINTHVRAWSKVLVACDFRLEMRTYELCSNSIVITIVASEVPGFSQKWVPIFYEAWSTAQDLPKPSSLWGSTSVLEQLNFIYKSCNRHPNWWLQPRAVFNSTFSGICHRNNKVDSIVGL